MGSVRRTPLYPVRLGYRLAPDVIMIGRMEIMMVEITVEIVVMTNLPFTQLASLRDYTGVRQQPRRLKSPHRHLTVKDSIEEYEYEAGTSSLGKDRSFKK